VPRLFTLKTLPNGISMYPPVTSNAIVAKANTYRDTISVPVRCRQGLL
jgi:hypothetical protein